MSNSSHKLKIYVFSLTKNIKKNTQKGVFFIRKKITNIIDYSLHDQTLLGYKDEYLLAFHQRIYKILS
jgi:hypothetical protein